MTLSIEADSIETGVRVMPKPLWRRILGEDFDQLPVAIRQMFDQSGHRYARGFSDVECGSHPLARLCILLSGFPKPGRDIPTSILFEAQGDTDMWHRSFGRRRFASAHRGKDGTLYECFGALTFVFRLSADAAGVTFKIVETRLFGIPLPRFISPEIAATQRQSQGRFRFEITVDLPYIGHMVKMVGQLGSAWPSAQQAARPITQRPALAVRAFDVVLAKS